MNIFSLFRKQPAKEDGHQRLWGFFGLTRARAGWCCRACSCTKCPPIGKGG